MMDTSDIKKLLWMWATLPLTAVDWWIAWGNLPERVVMKSDAIGRPIHWASRGDAMKFDLMLLGGVLLFLTLLSAIGLMSDGDTKRHQYFTAILAYAMFVFLVVNGILWFVQVGVGLNVIEQRHAVLHLSRGPG